MKLVNFRLPEDGYNQLLYYSNEKECSVSQIVRLAVESFLREMQEKQPLKKHRSLSHLKPQKIIVNDGDDLIDTQELHQWTQHLL